MTTLIASNQEVELIIVKAYRESVGKPNSDEGLSWAQAQRGEAYPIEKFWEMLNAE